MSIAVSAPTTAAASTSNATSYALGAFTPAANSYLVCMVFATGTVAAGSMSGGSLTWTKQKSQLYNTTDTAYLFTAPVGASPVSTTPTFSCTGDAATGCNMIIFQVTGQDATTPIVQTVSGTASSTNPHLTVTTEKTTSALLAAWAGQLTANSSTPPTGWTENGDVAFTTPAGNASGAFRAGGETATSVTFTAATSVWGMLYAEVAANSHFTATAAGSLGALRGAATGAETFTGTAAGRLGALLGAATGAETFSGTIAGRLGALRGAATGVEAFVGSASGLFGALRGSAAGAFTAGVSFTGSAAGRLGALRGAATGAEIFTGTAAGRLGGLRGAATAVEIFAGIAAGRLGGLRGSATGAETFTGTVAGRLGGLRGAAVGGYYAPDVSNATGAAAGKLIGLSGNARGAFKPNLYVQAKSYWYSKGIKPGTKVKDKHGHVGIAACNANGPFVILKTKGSIRIGKIGDWSKA